MKKYQKTRPKIKKKNKEIQRPKCTFAQLKNSKKKGRWFLLVYLLNMIPFVLIFLTAKIKSILQI
jgi:hypothetical protein